MTDEPVVQTTEPASVVVPVSTVGEATPVVVAPPTEPSAEEKMAKLIEQKVTEAVAKSTELAKRELQSTKDRAMAEVYAAQRRTRLAETTLGATRTHLQTIDPAIAEGMELAELRADRQGRQTMEQEDAQRQQQEAQARALQDSLVAHLEELGIAPDDKRIDWAEDSSNYLQGRRRFDASVAKIQRENIKAMEASIDVKIKEAEKRIKKGLGLEEANSVSTQMSGGISSEGIPTDITAFRKWIAGVPQKEYEEKYAAKVNEMMQQGRIK